MRRARLVPVVVIAAAVVTGCGSSDGGADGGSDGGSDGSSDGGVIEMVADAPADAAGASCDVERQTMTVAADAFLALTGAPPVTEQDLVDAELLREASTLFDVDAEGRVVPAPGGPCS